MAAKTPLVVLEDIRIAAPCLKPWDEMEGDDHQRYCDVCERYVYDLSAYSRSEAEHLVAVNDRPPCVRITRRPDGAVVTAQRNRSRANPVGLALGLWSAILLVTGCSKIETCTTTQGKPAFVRPTKSEEKKSEKEDTAPPQPERAP
jgi:hypothetical protein